MALALVAGLMAAPARAWQPSRPIELIVPAGTGGGADHMARAIRDIVTRYGLSPTAMVVINKAGGAGAEALLDIKAARGNPHRLIITLSNLFTTPLATGMPFNWREITPIAMIALDEFILWVNARSALQTPRDFITAIEAGAPGQFRMGGTGSRQEDQIIAAAIERLIGARMTYVPFRGGGEVAIRLVAGHVDFTVNNPIEAVEQWRAGKVRPLCVLDKESLPAGDSIAGGRGWGDIPTCASQGLAVEYLMLRGIFGAPGLQPAQVAFHVDMLNRLRDTPEWKRLMREGAYNPTFMTGQPFAEWLEGEEQRHRELMQSAGFLAGN